MFNVSVGCPGVLLPWQLQFPQGGAGRSAEHAHLQAGQDVEGGVQSQEEVSPLLSGVVL